MTQYEVRSKILHRPLHYLASQTTKSSLLTKLTTQPAMYNSLYGQTLRHLAVTVGLFSPVTTKIKSSNPFTVDVQSLTSPSMEQQKKLAGAFFNRLGFLLEAEGVQYDEKVLPQLIVKFFPDWRRVLNECQRYAIGGVIDNGILSSLSDVRFNELTQALKSKQYTTVKKWVSSNLDNEPSHIFRSVYDNLYQWLEPRTIPQAVLIIGKYQYQSAFVADQEINLLAALTEMMVECEFK